MKPAIIKPSRIALPLALLAAALASTGCASLYNANRHESSSVVRFLYPDKQIVVTPSTPTLRLPLRVGVAFVPPSHHGPSNRYREPALSEAARTRLIRKVTDEFKKLPYVQGIEIIPATYLREDGGFDNLDQLKSMLGVDVIALLAYDQRQVTTDTPFTLGYWTIVGAYIVPAQKNDTSTLIETVVYDIASRRLLFRAAGTSLVKHRSTIVGVDDRLAGDAVQGYDKAAADMTQNLHDELAAFKERIKEAPDEIKLEARPGYNLAAGALGFAETAGLLAFAILARLGRRAMTSDKAKNPMARRFHKLYE
jgi:rhombotail lipoprotein